MIIGIDPGTTSAYAIMDTEGQLVAVRSGKDLELNSIISETSKYGIPIAVGTDRRKLPDTIGKYAAKTGTLAVSPEEDLGVREKQAMTSAFQHRNDHERDAIASAMAAYSKLQPLLERISKALAEKGHSELKVRITKKVIIERTSISEALKELTGKEAEKTGEKPKPEMKTEARKPENLMMLERENGLLMKHNRKLLNALKKAKQKNERLKKPKTESSEQDYKGRLIQSLTDKLKQKETEISLLKSEMLKANMMLAESKGKTILKKMPDLTWQSYARIKSEMGIYEGDMLLVENPNNLHERAIRELEGRVSAIIHRQPAGKEAKKLGFTMIEAEKLNLTENERIAIAEKSQIENAKQEKNVISRIIEAYRKERQQ